MTVAADDAVVREKILSSPAFAKAGIKTLIVNFDGYGDSGQIESIDAWAKRADDPDLFTAGQSLPFPSNLKLLLPPHDPAKPPTETTLQDKTQSNPYSTATWTRLTGAGRTGEDRPLPTLPAASGSA